MNNLLSFKRGMPLRFTQNETGGSFLEQTLFFAGVAFSILLPESICSIYGGLLAVIAFVGSLVIGTALGLILYFYRPFQITSCFARGILPKAPPGGALKKVA